MAIESKTKEIHPKEVEKKRTKMEEDALTNLPDSLQLHILSLLDTKQAVQTSALSKTFVSLWKLVPVLQFKSAAFRDLKAFDEFVDTVLRLGDQSHELDSLIFNRQGRCSANILKKVLSYAFSRSVKKLEVFIEDTRNDTWPLYTCSESLISLKLESDCSVNCPFLGPRSGSFKNLSVLYLRLAIIFDPEPFSGFPSLKKLTLLDCHPDQDTALNICALQLTHLTIASYEDPFYVEKFSSCKLTTPKLRFFDYRGPDFPPLQTHDGLPGLDTMIIDFHARFCPRKKDERRFEELLSLFSMVRNAKSLTLFASLVYFLASFHDELVNRDSPFNNLKSLKFDLRYSRHASQYYRVMAGEASKVIGYLLQNSPDAELIWAEDVDDGC